MRITSTGNVGLGTTSPSQLLTIGSGAPQNTVVHINGNSANYTGNTIQSAGTEKWFTGMAGSADYTFRNRGANNYVTIQDGTGNVGIGTTAPVDLLTLQKSTSADMLHLQAPSGGGSYTGIRFEGGSGGWDLAAIRAVDAGSYNGDMAFLTDGDGTANHNVTEKMRLTAAGNVGVGTTNPQSKLNIAGNGAAAAGNGLIIGTVGNSISTSGAVGAETGRFEIAFPGWRDVEPNQIGAKIDGIRKNNYQANNALVQSTELAFYTGTGSDGGSTTNILDLSTERMRIDQNGNVGVGTTSPGSQLTVVSPGNTTSAYLTVLPQNLSQSVNVGYNHIWEAGSNGNNALYIDAQSSAALVLQANGGSGNVGIGTTSPGYPLTVVGTANVGMLTTNQANAFVAGASGLTEADILIGSPTYGNRHDSSILFWTASSADRISATSGRFNFDEYSTIGGSGAFITGTAGGTSYFSGSVGIGTTNPGYPLTINNSIAAIGLYSTAGNQAFEQYYDGTVAKWQVGKDSDNGFFIWDSIAARLAMKAYSSGNLTLMPSGGNVGIGTTAPIAPLQVGGNILIGNPTDAPGTTSALQFGDASSSSSSNGVAGDIEMLRENWGGTMTLGVLYPGGYAGTYTSKLALGQDGGGLGIVQFFTNPSPSSQQPVEVVRIDGHGNVGVGTTSPGYTLDVQRSDGLYEVGAFRNPNTTGAMARFIDSSGNLVAFGSESGQASIRTNNTQRLTIDNSGNVGVGTTAPNNSLQVSQAGNGGLTVTRAGSGSGSGKFQVFTGGDTGIDSDRDFLCV